MGGRFSYTILKRINDQNDHGERDSAGFSLSFLRCSVIFAILKQLLVCLSVFICLLCQIVNSYLAWGSIAIHHAEVSTSISNSCDLLGEGEVHGREEKLRVLG